MSAVVSSPNPAAGGSTTEDTFRQAPLKDRPYVDVTAPVTMNQATYK